MANLNTATESCSAQEAWWLWPHLWSLDAPLVAIAWQSWWARATGATLSWRQELILALAVWMIYLADRLADTTQNSAAEHGTARHSFYAKRRRVVFPLVVGSGLVLSVLTPWWLTVGEFAAGLGLLAMAAGYFGLIHLWRIGRWMAFLPKEAMVGGMFALGTVLFVGCRDSRGVGSWVLVAVVGFAVVCFLNCALITRWEGSTRDRHDPVSFPNAFPRVSRHLGMACWACALVFLTLHRLSGNPVFAPLALSAGLLGLLDHCQAAVSANALRVLADVVLLTPWCLVALG